MATPIERMQAVLGAYKNPNQDQPTSAKAVATAQSLVRQYEGQWNNLLTNKGQVRNPASNDDLFDFGAMNETDPENPVYEPANQNKKDRFACLLALRIYRQFTRSQVKADKLKNAVAVATDAGKTPAEIKERITSDADTELNSIVGNDGDVDGE